MGQPRPCWFALLLCLLSGCGLTLKRQRLSMPAPEGPLEVSLWYAPAGQTTAGSWYSVTLDFLVFPVDAVASTVAAVGAATDEDEEVEGGVLGWLAALLPGVSTVPGVFQYQEEQILSRLDPRGFARQDARIFPAADPGAVARRYREFSTGNQARDLALYFNWMLSDPHIRRIECSNSADLGAALLATAAAEDDAATAAVREELWAGFAPALPEERRRWNAESESGRPHPIAAGGAAAPPATGEAGPRGESGAAIEEGLFDPDTRAPSAEGWYRATAAFGRAVYYRFARTGAQADLELRVVAFRAATEHDLTLTIVYRQEDEDGVIRPFTLVESLSAGRSAAAASGGPGSVQEFSYMVRNPVRYPIVAVDVAIHVPVRDARARLPG